jgi:hypothetical protein
VLKPVGEFHGELALADSAETVQRLGHERGPGMLAEGSLNLGKDVLATGEVLVARRNATPDLRHGRCIGPVGLHTGAVHGVVSIFVICVGFVSHVPRHLSCEGRNFWVQCVRRGNMPERTW